MLICCKMCWSSETRTYINIKRVGGHVGHLEHAEKILRFGKNHGKARCWIVFLGFLLLTFKIRRVFLRHSVLVYKNEHTKVNRYIKTLKNR